MSDLDDFTELVDFDPDRVDLVEKAANGTRILVAKSAEGEPVGLFEPDFVEEMIAKSEADAPEAFIPNTAPITLSGSPAAVADMMARVHQASVQKAQMSTSSINDLPDSAFAHIEPGGKKDAEGKTTPRDLRHYPVHDEAHAKDALGRAQAQINGGKPDGKRIAQAAMPKIKAAAKKFGVSVSKADGDPTDPGSPAWESQDAANADAVVAKILGCIPAVKALAMREATEVGAGHLDDIGDVFELQGAIDALTCAAQTVAAFAVSERVEAGESVTKAQPAAPTTAATAATSPKENTVDTTTTTEVAKTEATAAAGTEQPVSKAAALAAQLGISPEKLAEIGAQHVLKAAQDAAAGTQTSDATPAPAESARTIPGTDTVQSPVVATDEVSKAAATQLATAFGEAVAPVAKQLSELATQVGAQLERVEKMAAQPDDRRSPLLNGATGEAGPALRDAMAKSPEWQTIAKAVSTLPDGPAKDEAKRSLALQALEARFS